jgi:hypothetical protein
VIGARVARSARLAGSLLAALLLATGLMTAYTERLAAAQAGPVARGGEGLPEARDDLCRPRDPC